MTQTDWIFIIVAVVLTVFGSMLAAGETALQTVSRKRAERMVADGIRGADRVLDIEADPAPTINTAMLLRIVCETGAVILGCLVVFDNFDHDWERIGIPLLVLSIIDFIVWGVMPRTLGRQRAEQTAVRAARPLGALTSLFGWLTSGLILVGNA